MTPLARAGKAGSGRRPASQETCPSAQQREQPPEGRPREPHVNTPLVHTPLIAAGATSDAQARERKETLAAALVAALLGCAILFTVGFAGADALHDSAHDSRHALGFPCH